MKKIFILLLLLVGAKSAYSQVVAFEMGSIKVDSIYISGIWVDSVSTDGTMGTVHNRKLMSSQAINTFMRDTIPAWIHDSITAIDFSTTALQDSIDSHTDSLQLHNTRLKTMEAIDHTHPNKATLDATTSAFTTTINSTISGHTTYIANVLDSVARHTDSIQSHNDRIKQLEGASGSGFEVTIEPDPTGDTTITYFNGSFGWRAGFGDGEVDTTGLPVANRITYFTTANKIGSATNIGLAGDSLALFYLDGAASGSRFAVITPTGAIDSGVLHAVYRGLTDKIWDIHGHLKDRKNKEIAWYHINDKEEVVKTYGLPGGMDAFEALQYTAEMSLRLIADQDKRIALLERKEYRMSRQDYKYKAKLLKLENRLTK